MPFPLSDAIAGYHEQGRLPRALETVREPLRRAPSSELEFGTSRQPT